MAEIEKTTEVVENSVEGGKGKRSFDKSKSDRGGSRNNGRREDKPKKEFDEALLEVRRVTRVTTGGRKMSFRAIIVVGNKKGKIGLGIAKGPDVAAAVKKATNEAYKNVTVVPVTEADSVPYGITSKYKSSVLRLLPAAPGTGLKAGSALRVVLDLAGYVNILTKIIGTNNKLNNALSCIRALSMYKSAEGKKTQGVKTYGKVQKPLETSTDVVTDKTVAPKVMEKSVETKEKKKVEKSAKSE